MRVERNQSRKKYPNCLKFARDGFSVPALLLCMGLPWLHITPAAFAGEREPLLRRMLDSADKAQTELIEEYSREYITEICDKDRPPVNAEGLKVVRQRASRIARKCYDSVVSQTGSQGIEKSYQEWAEDLFFDSLVQNKMDNLSCREAAMNCLEDNATRTQIATDFVNRFNAYKIYKDKYQKFDSATPEQKQKMSFTPEEKKIFGNYLLSIQNDRTQELSVAEFFKAYPPVVAMAFIVSDGNPDTSKGFLFQETFLAMAKDETALEQFSGLQRSEQIHLIVEHLQNSKNKQIESIKAAKAELQRSCRLSDGSKGGCFYRPMYEQKRKLLEEYITQTAYDPNQWAKASGSKGRSSSLSEQEKNFACQLQLKYGEGGQRFDNAMNKMQLAFAVAPFGRAIIGAMAEKRLASGVMAGYLGNKSRLGPIVDSTAVGLTWAARLALVSQASRIYQKCSEPNIKAQPKIPYTPSQSFKSREEFLADCRSCQRRPSSRKVVDHSCMKEAINLIVGRAILTSKFATATQMADKAASEGDDTPKINEQINRAGEALSLFLSNLALTTDFDLPIGSGFDDELESSDGVPASSK